MKHFLELIERTRSTHTAVKQSRAPFDRKFWEESFKLAQVFVFDDLGEHLLDTTDKTKLDLPFQCCSFEAMGDGIVLTPESGNEIEHEDMKSITILSMCVRENAPLDYSYIGLYQWVDARGVTCQSLRAVKHLDPLEDKFVYTFLNRFLEMLARGEVGTESVRQKVKIGTGAEKCHHTIRQVIRVVSRKNRITIRPLYSREIDWSHRFRVRGHWRKVAGLGKDREGRYSVHGYTWVVDFTKGPEDKPLVEKVRVVKNVEEKSGSDGGDGRDDRACGSSVGRSSDAPVLGVEAVREEVKSGEEAPAQSPAPGPEGD